LRKISFQPIFASGFYSIPDFDAIMKIFFAVNENIGEKKRKDERCKSLAEKNKPIISYS